MRNFWCLGRSIWGRTSFFYVFLNMEVIFGLLSTTRYSVVSMKNKKCHQTRVPPEPELSSGCSSYYWCGRSMFTVTSIHYWEISSRRMVSQCILGVFGSIVLGIIILLIAYSLLRSDRLSRIIMPGMHHHASASCITGRVFNVPSLCIMSLESCQESQNFCMCLLFWNPNPIYNR
jgi:hypothetical protein